MLTFSILNRDIEKRAIELSKEYDLDNIFSALAHPVRRAILEFLARDSDGSTVTQLLKSQTIKQFKISRPAISQHLGVLNESGLLEQTIDGRHRNCQFNYKPFILVFDWIIRYNVAWNLRLDGVVKELELESESETGE